MGKITYEDKVALIENPDIPDINKVKSTDMNEIKSVVNENDDKFLTNGLNVSNEVDEDYRVNLLETKNLFTGELELGNYNSSTGAKETNNSIYRNVNAIPVKPNTTYTFSINGVSQKYVVYYYDKNGTFLSNDQSLTTGTFTTPNNCYYLNFRCFGADFTSDYANLKVQLELGSSATTYSAFVPNQILVDNEKYTDTLNVGSVVDSRSRVNFLKSNNLFNKDTIKTNCYIDQNGNIVEDSGNFAGDYIELDTNKTYYVSASTNQAKRIAYYNSSKTFVSRELIIAYSDKLTIPSNAKYVRLSCYNTDLDSLMLNEGSTALPYEPYITPSIYVDDEEIYSKGVVLWQNDTGVSNATITLSDSPSNYSSFDIDIVNTGAAYNYLTIHIPRNTGRVNLISYITGGVDNLNIHYSKYVFSGNTLQYDWAGKIVFQGGALTQSSGNTISIIKVIGYK